MLINTLNSNLISLVKGISRYELLSEANRAPSKIISQSLHLPFRSEQLSVRFRTLPYRKTPQQTHYQKVVILAQFLYWLAVSTGDANRVAYLTNPVNSLRNE
jgi:hypothetical protein